ncbi:hypothetical protein [Opitutus sp. ER46]|uniref:hypothetical protein n=1 Tax=Opitutus sp. ER46 TaxID=2161864 RepID=UPI000D315351|nr:hypothetical protein [Opitutus sp. ER46]
MRPSSSLFPVRSPHDAARWRRFLLGCFLFVVGVRCFLVERLGASIALVDEWEATGREVLSAWAHGTFSLAALFEAHNGDHRIVATRLWEIFWFTVNGAWDPKLVMIAKTVIFGAAATGFIHLLAGALDRTRFALGTLLAALFAFPFGYRNLLWAFQSQFDFFLLTAAGALCAVVAGRRWLALALAAAAPFTLGAGPVVAATLALVALLAGVFRLWPARAAVGYGLVALALAAGGAALRAAHAAPLGPPGDQAFTLAKLLAWPYSNFLLIVAHLPETARLVPGFVLRLPSAEQSLVLAAARTLQAHPALHVTLHVLLALLLTTPLLLLAARIARTRRLPSAAIGIVVVGLLALLLQGASAVARSTEILVQTRFLDVVALFGFTAMAAAVFLARSAPRLRRWLVLWAALIVPGYLATMGATAIQLAHGKEREWVPAVRAFFPSRDLATLPENTNWQLPILERDPTAFAALLADPAMAAVLPRSILAPEEPPRPVARIVFAVARLGWLLALAGTVLLATATRAPRHCHVLRDTSRRRSPAEVSRIA